MLGGCRCIKVLLFLFLVKEKACSPPGKKNTFSHTALPRPDWSLPDTWPHRPWRNEKGAGQHRCWEESSFPVVLLEVFTNCGASKWVGWTRSIKEGDKYIIDTIVAWRNWTKRRQSDFCTNYGHSHPGPNRLCFYRKDYVFPGVATWLENFMCIMYGFLIGKMVKLSILAIQNKDF